MSAVLIKVTADIHTLMHYANDIQFVVGSRVKYNVATAEHAE